MTSAHGHDDLAPAARAARWSFAAVSRMRALDEFDLRVRVCEDTIEPVRTLAPQGRTQTPLQIGDVRDPQAGP